MNNRLVTARPRCRAALWIGLLAASTSAQASDFDADAPLYSTDSVDYGLGLTQMGIELCESLEQAAVEAGVAEEDMLSRAECESQLAPSLRERFPADQCEAGGLYLAPLEACLNAMKDIIALKGNHSAQEHEAYVQDIEATLMHVCDPSNICRPHRLPTLPL